jgi:hypothetical protein
VLLLVAALLAALAPQAAPLAAPLADGGGRRAVNVLRPARVVLALRRRKF